ITATRQTGAASASRTGSGRIANAACPGARRRWRCGRRRACSCCGRCPRRLLQTIAEAAYRQDAYAALLELLAQAMHVDFYRIGADFFAPFAEMVDQLILADHLAAARQQDLQ